MGGTYMIDHVYKILAKILSNYSYTFGFVGKKKILFLWESKSNNHLIIILLPTTSMIMVLETTHSCSAQWDPFGFKTMPASLTATAYYYSHLDFGMECTYPH